MTMRKTRWFSGRKNVPGHVGVFQVKVPTSCGFPLVHPYNLSYAYWDGTRWSQYAATAFQAMWYVNNPSSHQDLQFRGYTTQQA